MKKLVIFCHGDTPRIGELERLLPRLNIAYDICHTGGGAALPASADVYDGQIIMGGAMSMTELEKYPWLEKETAWVEKASRAGLPTLGICLGCQMLAHVNGGKVVRGGKGLCTGFGNLAAHEEDAVFGDGLQNQRVLLWHEDTYSITPEHRRLMTGYFYTEQATRFAPKVYGLQFHPEANQTLLGHWYQRDVLARGETEPRTATFLDMEKEGQERFTHIHSWLEGFLERLFLEG